MKLKPVSIQIMFVSFLLLLNGCATVVLVGRGNTVDTTAAVNSSDKSCQVFERYERTPIPDLPTLDDNRTYSDQELALLQAEHIHQLRDWINTERQRDDEVYLNYIRRCKH